MMKALHLLNIPLIEMKASELIKKLQKSIDKHGDKEVIIHTKKEKCNDQECLLYEKKDYLIENFHVIRQLKYYLDNDELIILTKCHHYYEIEIPLTIKIALPILIGTLNILYSLSMRNMLLPSYK